MEGADYLSHLHVLVSGPVLWKLFQGAKGVADVFAVFSGLDELKRAGVAFIATLWAHTVYAVGKIIFSGFVFILHFFQ